MFAKHTSVSVQSRPSLWRGHCCRILRQYPAGLPTAAPLRIFPQKIPLFQNHDWDPGGRAEHVPCHPFSPSVLQPRPRLLLLHPDLRPQQPQLQVLLLQRGVQLVELEAESKTGASLPGGAAEKEGWMVWKPLQLVSWVPALVWCSAAGRPICHLIARWAACR